MTDAQKNGYNGWSNYETWNVVLWLNNDQAIYNEVSHLIKQEDHDQDAANAVRAYLEELNPIASDASLYSDLLTHAFDQVNWIEVVSAFQEEA